MMKSGQFPGVEFISVDYPSYSAIRDTFRKLYNACLPKDARSRLGGVFRERHRGGGGGGSDGSDHESSNLAASSNAPGDRSGSGADGGGRGGGTQGDIITAIAESGWLDQIQSLLQLAGVLVDLMSIQGSSVAVCLEDGVDIVAQVKISVAKTKFPFHLCL